VAFGQLNIQPEVHFVSESVPNSWSASNAYVVFKGDTPVVELANRTLLARAQNLLAAFKKQFAPGMGSGKGEVKTDVSISYYTTQLITGLMTSYSYTGGAHGNTRLLPYNFAMVNGAAKELRFSDVFKAGAADEVSQRVMWKLQGVERATSIAEGTVTAMTPEQLNRFTITKNGVKFYFEHYELGPYSAGSFNVTLIFSEIEDLLIPNGPASLIR
jgi:hypothetical protein